MKPYYQDSAVTIYNCDCRSVTLWVDGAHVLVTDPPYGVAHASGWLARPIVGDADTASRDQALSLWGERPALVFGQWSQPKPARTKACLTWDKGEWPGMGDLSLPWGPSTEEIYVLGNGFIGKRGGTLISRDRVNGSSQHPNEKPVSLLTHLITYCPADWVIADPFMGSGTTLRAAKDLGRKAIGIEIEERYCEIAAKRMAQEVFQFSEQTRRAADSVLEPLSTANASSNHKSNET